MSSQDSHPLIAAPGSFLGRTVIVSGSVGKLGRVISIALAAAGANVVLNDVKAEQLQEQAQSLTEQGFHPLVIPTSGADGTSVVTQAIEHFGQIDAIIAPTLGPIPWQPLEDVTENDFRAAFEANVLAPLSLARAAWPYFKKQQYGRVVNFTSDSILGFPTASTYTFTKGALFGVNKTLAMEGAAYGIKVNCVSPIAYLPHMERHIQRFSDDVQHAFKDYYFPEANVPMILALASEGCTATGQVFHTAGWAVGRNVWGITKSKNELRTVGDCLKEMEALVDNKEVFEPASMVDFTEFQAAYVLGKND